MKEVAAVHTYSICFQLFPFKHRLIADKTVSFKILQLRFACLPTYPLCHKQIPSLLTILAYEKQAAPEGLALLFLCLEGFVL